MPYRRHAMGEANKSHDEVLTQTAITKKKCRGVSNVTLP